MTTLAAVIALDRPAYLGLDRDPAFRAAVARGMERYGVHYAGSRAAAYCPGVYAEAEAYLARKIGVADVVLVGSGSLAAKLTTEALGAAGYDIIDRHDPARHHPAMHPCWPEATAIYDDRQLGRVIAEAPPDRRLAVRRVTIDPLTLGTSSRVSEMWAPDARVLDVADASHDLLLRPLTALFVGQVFPHEVVVASLGKVLSIPAGVIAGPRAVTEVVRALPAFRGASPPPPAYAAAVLALGERLLERQSRLNHVAAHVELACAPLEAAGAVKTRGLSYPVIVVRDGALVARLTSAGFVLSVIRYPAAESPLLHRIVLRADLRDEEVARLCAVLA